jgi:hypothetical protein
MKYLVMVLGTQADYEGMRGKASPYSPAWSPVELQAMYDHMGAINDDLAKTGELIDGQGLAEPARTRLVSVDERGEPVIADGPYRESEELMAGYWLLDCASLDRVTEIAARVARCPGPEGLKQYPVVIRPVLDGVEGV